MQINQISTNFLEENCWVLTNAKNEVVIIDPGSDVKKILAEVGDKKVVWILLTHSHFDHVGALHEVAEKTKGRVAIHVAEAEIVKKGMTNPSYCEEKLTPTPVARELKDGDLLEFDEEKIKVLHTPGHTPGSCCFLLGENLFAGDTLFRRNCGRVDLEGGDAAAMQESLKKLTQLPENTIIYSGHGENWNMHEAKKFHFPV